jgi:hypothetical protein
MAYITAAFLLAALPASTRANLAQQDNPRDPPPPGRGRDKPIQRTGPRAEIYERAAQDLKLPSGKEVKPLVLSLEERGFFLRDALVLLLIAKTRAEQLIEQGKFKKESYPQALRASTDEFAKLVEEEGAGFLTLLMRAGIKEDLRNFVARTQLTLGLISQVAPTIPDPEVEERRARALAARQKAAAKESDTKAGDKGARDAPAARKTAKPDEIMAQLGVKEEAEEKAPPAKTTAKPGENASKPDGREKDATDEKNFPPEVIYKNLAKELAVTPELAKQQVTRLEAEMPLREAVMTMLVADLYGSKKIQEGKYPKERRGEALQEGIDLVVNMVRAGEGWGNMAKRLGFGVSGASLNKRANSIIGQK